MNIFKNVHFHMDPDEIFIAQYHYALDFRSIHFETGRFFLVIGQPQCCGSTKTTRLMRFLVEIFEKSSGVYEIQRAFLKPFSLKTRATLAFNGYRDLLLFLELRSKNCT